MGSEQGREVCSIVVVYWCAVLLQLVSEMSSLVLSLGFTASRIVGIRSLQCASRILVVINTCGY